MLNIKKENGFTLMELIMVVGISLFIFVTIYYMANLSLKSWETQNKQTLMTQEIHFAMSRITSVVKNASSITLAQDKTIEFVLFPEIFQKKDAYTISLWHFNEGAGVSAYDSSGSNTGTLKGIGEPNWITQSIDGKALLFDGVDDFVNCGNNNSLNLTDNLNISAWIRPSPGNLEYSIFYKEKAYRLYISAANKLVGSIYYSNAWHDISGYSSIVRNGSTWTHVALCYFRTEGSGEELKLLINGTIDITASNDNQINVSTDNLYIGRDTDNSRYAFGGTIDEVKISNKLQKTKIYWTGTKYSISHNINDKLSLYENYNDVQLEGGYTDSFQINYYDNNYNRLIPSLGTDTQSERNNIKQIKISLVFDWDGTQTNLESTITLRKESPPPTATISVGIVGYWQMDELSWNGTSGEVKDVSGKGNNGTAKNGASTDPVGKINRSGSFDGINDYIDIPNTSDINTGGPYSSRTISLWFRANSTTKRKVIYKEGDAARGFNIYVNYGMLYVGGWDIGDYSPAWTGTWPSVHVISNTWYHIALILDNATDTVTPNKFTTYLYGNLFGIGSGANVYAHSGPIRIASNGGTLFHDGSGNSSNNYYGKIDEVRVYSRALAIEELKELAGFTDYDKPGFDLGTYNQVTYNLNRLELEVAP